MNKTQIIKELNALEALAYATIQKAEILRNTLGVSTPKVFKKRNNDLSIEQEAKIIAKRKKYYEQKKAATKKAAASNN